MIRRLGVLALLALAGCGPSSRELREQTLSTLNTAADTWGGEAEFATDAIDAYNRPVTALVEKTTLHVVLTLRSNGPDGLPKNGDDITVSRTKRHGETTRTAEAAKAAEGVVAGAVKGAVKGVRDGVGLGTKK